MPRRLLNIASIVCLVACVAFVVLWVRSYYWSHSQPRKPLTVTTTFFVESARGRLMVCDVPLKVFDIFDKTTYWPLMIQTSVSGFNFGDHTAGRGGLTSFGFEYFSGRFSVLTIPYWFLVLTSGSMAMAFQLRWPPRFTLRDLFIATTFLAGVLGMIAWLDRAWIGK